MLFSSRDSWVKGLIVALTLVMVFFVAFALINRKPEVQDKSGIAWARVKTDCPSGMQYLVLDRVITPRMGADGKQVQNFEVCK